MLTRSAAKNPAVKTVPPSEEPAADTSGNKAPPSEEPAADNNGKKAPGSSRGSQRSSAASLRARRLAAEALHARRLADIEAAQERAAAESERAAAERERAAAERAAERERIVANLEHEADIAALYENASVRSGSSRSSIVDSWLVAHNSQMNFSESQMTIRGKPTDASPVLGAERARVIPPSADVAGIPDVSSAVREHAPCFAPAHLTATAPRGERTVSPVAAGDRAAARGRAPIAVPGPMAGQHHSEVPPLPPAAATAAAAAAAAPLSHYIPYTTTHMIGTRNENCEQNKDDRLHVFNNTNESSDILKLAEVITDLARSNRGAAGPGNLVALPMFSGSPPTHWLTFRSAYINSKSSFSATENIGRLANALRGAARDSVAPLLALSRDPEEVMEALQEQFGQPELLIRHLVSEVKGLPKLTASDGGKELHQLACVVRNCVHTIKMLGSIEFLASPELLQCVLLKLTPLVREKWVDYAFMHAATGPQFKLELLSSFLTHQSRVHLRFGIVDDVSRPKPIDRARAHVTATASTDIDDLCYATSANPAASKFLKGKASPSTAGSRNRPKPASPVTTCCVYCQKPGHEVDKCDAFKVLTVDDRWRWVKDNKVCQKCLIRGKHYYQSCKGNCGVKDCRSRNFHHELLHKLPIDLVNYSTTAAPDAELEAVPVAHILGSIDGKSSEARHRPALSQLKVLPVTVIGPKGKMDIYCLLDDGSSVTLIDETVAETIGAEGPRGTVRVNCMGGLAKDSVATYITIQVKGKYSTDTFTLERVRSIPNLGLAKQTVRSVDIEKFTHLKDLVSELCFDDARPLLLLGIDHWNLSLPQGVRRGSRNQPVAVRTALGWTVFGKLPGKHLESVNHGFVPDEQTESILHSSVSDLESIIKQHYRLDSIGIAKRDSHSINDERALAILEETTRRLPSGRFETGLLWRPDITSIPDSYNLALSRLLSLERKFKKDPSYAEAYRRYISDMIAKNYAEPCTSAPAVELVWYLPHFGIYHPQKRKLRVVHDAAARCSGVSLNSLLLQGPDLLQPLLAILMRFREGEVALTADIREMYPQTKIRSEDRDAQRFLWRQQPTSPVCEYRMSSMMFGATSSPCTAIFLKNKNALEHKATYPEAADAIVRDHYVDDYLGSVDSPDAAAQLAADIVTVHKAACLEMRSWVSNDPKALSLLTPDLKAVDALEVGLGPTSPSQVRILGVAWNVVDDSFSFKKTFSLPTKLTKRKVLSHLMQVYDPLGFLLPMVVAGRILFQETWRMGVGWDEELPAPARAKWQAWFTSLAEASSNISIPRCYRTKQVVECQLHLLADSSELAYACVAFWRFVRDDGSVHLAFIGGKARLAPLKPVSIPRLELQAALMATRFATYVLEAHRITVGKVIFWTDSLTVLKWLRSDARTFKPFVAHRVGEILETSDVANWRYIPSALNVADDATRGKVSLSSTSRWYTGPDFLLSPAEDWPREPLVSSPPILEEMKPDHALTFLVTEQPEVPHPIVAHHSRFSRWIRLVRATARAHNCAKIFRLNKCQNSKFTRAASNVSSTSLKPLSAQEILEAERHLLLSSQLESFNAEYVRLIANLPPPNQGKLKALTLMVGEDQLIRLYSRTCCLSDAPAQDANPIVLDGRHQTVKLLVDEYHRKFGHANNETVVNILRSKYYILSLRPTVKSVAKRCSFCRIKKTLPAPAPQFGNLPEDRLSHHHRPFSYVGLDYFGPVEVVVGRRREKRWVALFTCLTTRAVHLEVVGSLTSDSAIMALRRFISRRGCPVRITSDNGTAFVGAARQLAEVFDFAANQKIEWAFICPAAPSMGGAWERLVRSIKTALDVTMKQRALKEEMLTTLLMEAEAIVNSRPLTHVPVDPDTLQAITPFHFLVGTPSTEATRPCQDADLQRRVCHKKVLRLAEVFWARWLKEYLPTLMPRRAGATAPPVQIGDLVLIADSNLPRGTWPKGRIVKMHTGPDGIARVVEISTAKGTLRRPVRKVVPLTSEQGTQENYVRVQ